ncbi:J domain-containing protein [Pantanalinema rosaneae CENA516]|uniref:J domain-containing protein n=1 Tax=Pantanalinema rosaneae TaxID=1620701 RepID=UPI003D6DB88E
MVQSPLPPDWLQQFSDPYAVLGVSVAADDRRIQKRYRQIAMVLHPDRFAGNDAGSQDLASQLLARLINPTYEKLKQEQNRKESLALLRLQVRKLTREKPLSPQSELAQQLMTHPASNVDVFYEQAIAKLAETQYQPIEQFQTITLELTELNQVYLRLKMGSTPIREQRTGLVPATEAQPVAFTPAPSHPETVTESYAQRHYRRAQEYARQGRWPQVVQEMRDAIRIEADHGEYHALLGVAYLHQNMTGTAKAYIRRALELNPEDAIANRYAARLGLTPTATNASSPNGRSPASSATPSTNQTRNAAANSSRSHVSTSHSSRVTPQKRGLFGWFRSILKFFRNLFTRQRQA